MPILVNFEGHQLIGSRYFLKLIFWAVCTDSARERQLFYYRTNLEFASVCETARRRYLRFDSMSNQRCVGGSQCQNQKQQSIYYSKRSKWLGLKVCWYGFPISEKFCHKKKLILISCVILQSFIFILRVLSSSPIETIYCTFA